MNFNEVTLQHSSVSKNPESLSVKLKFVFFPARCLLFSKMNSSKQENRSKFSFYS